MKKILCATLDGIKAKTIEVETVFARALPGFSIVGLAQTSIQEAKERVKAALSEVDFKFPALKIISNLSPSDIRKEGSHFDLALAISIFFQKDKINFTDIFVFGELGLDGSLKDTPSIFPIILSLSQTQDLKKVLVPKESLEKVSLIPNIEVFGVSNLKEAIAFFMGEGDRNNVKVDYSYDYIEINSKKYYYLNEFLLDFKEVKGQEIAKRASLIAAAGMHNILYEGSPGTGKSMCAKRLQYIMPPLSMDEILLKASLSSFEAKEINFKPIRNFRSPHNSSTRSSVFGGGSGSPKPGEAALANGGILFFDEFPHFQKDVIESLREPLEDHKILISRVNSKLNYETKFLFVAAQNPCPCGNLLSAKKECRCNDLEIQKYKNKISSPILDRIDIFIQTSELEGMEDAGTDSKEMFEGVKKAFIAQKQRGQEDFNGKLCDKDIVTFCKLDNELENLLNTAAARFGLSLRSIGKIKKVARTIADLEQSKDIQKSHLLEALSYRKRD